MLGDEDAGATILLIVTLLVLVAWAAFLIWIWFG